MHQPIPTFDYSFNMLPWRRRIRWCLSNINLGRVDDEAFRLTNPSLVRNELDEELDVAFWSPNADVAYRNLRSLMKEHSGIAAKSASSAQRNEIRVKKVLLDKALADALAGVRRRSSIPRWKTYSLEVVKTKGGWQRVFFTAEDNGHAFDWLLQAVLDQECEILDEFKWGVKHLYARSYNNSVRDVDITDAFWEYAYPVAENPMSLF